MTKETGGPAFPSKDIKLVYPKDEFPPEVIAKLHEIKVEHTGMTLRDYFAGQALVGLLAMVQNNCADVWKSKDKAAEYAYQYADAMLAARKDSDEP